MKIPILLQDWEKSGKWKVEKWKIPILEAPNLVATPQALELVIAAATFC